MGADDGEVRAADRGPRRVRAPCAWTAEDPHRHAIVREGARRILESQPGFEVLAETVGLTTAVPLVESLRPDVLVLGMDPAQPVMLDPLTRS